MTELENARLPVAGAAAAVYVQVKIPEAPGESVSEAGTGPLTYEASEESLRVGEEDVGATVAVTELLFCTVI
jgi:hypothetical protein